MNRKERKRVLLIGDSIRMHYTPIVRRKLRKSAEILIIDENCQDSRKVKANLLRWIDNFNAESIDIIHFNCGLHDIKKPFDAEENQVPIEEYRQNLEDIVEILKERTDAVLIWANTTPVIFERHHEHKSFDRHLEDVIDYNEVARLIMEKGEIPINDLYAELYTGRIGKYIKKDGVHLRRRGNRIIANKVAGYISDYLK